MTRLTGSSTNNIIAANVDTNYQLFISNETSGTFNTAGGIMLTHELNNFTMSEAVKWYPQLKQAFKVWGRPQLRLEFQR